MHRTVFAAVPRANSNTQSLFFLLSPFRPSHWRRHFPKSRLASGSKSMKSGFFLMAGNIFNWVEIFFWDLANLQERSAFAAVSQCLKSGIWYPSTIVSLLNTPRFHHRTAAFSCRLCIKRKQGPKKEKGMSPETDRSSEQFVRDFFPRV